MFHSLYLNNSHQVVYHNMYNFYSLIHKYYSDIFYNKNYYIHIYRYHLFYNLLYKFFYQLLFYYIFLDKFHRSKICLIHQNSNNNDKLDNNLKYLLNYYKKYNLFCILSNYYLFYFLQYYIYYKFHNIF